MAWQTVVCTTGLLLAAPVMAMAGSAQFDIAIQPLAAALKAFASQSHMQLLYQYSAVEGVTANAVVGNLDSHVALTHLLQGTGLEAIYSGEDAATIRPIQSPATPNSSSPPQDSLNAPPKDSTGADATTPAATDESGPSRTENPHAAELEQIVVTGSRIKRTQVEGPAPMTTITSEDIEREGFTTPYEALATLTQQTGSGVESEFSSGGQTPNASELDLRGLGPGHVLVLFNGRRAADYPLPFNGKSNIVNLNSIPLAALDRVEILSGGASAIYGSDAVSGVVNFIMRDHFDGIEINARAGDTNHGNGQTERVQLTGGFNDNAFKGVYTFEYLNRKPLWAADSKYFNSTADDLSGNASKYVPIVALVQPIDAALFQSPQLADPGATVCARYGPAAADLAFPGLGTTCGSSNFPAQFTMRNETQSESGFFNSTYDFEGGLQAFGTLSLWHSGSGLNPLASTPSQNFYQGPLTFDVNPNVNPADRAVLGGQYLLPIRFFQLSEVGRDYTLKYNEFAWDTALGLRGRITEHALDWELAYHHSGYNADQDERQLLGPASNNFFLGPQQPGADPLGLGTPVFNFDPAQTTNPITRAQYDSITAIDHTQADSSNDQLSVQLTGNLFNLPAGPVKFASVLEWGTQQYQIHLDPRLVAGDFLGATQAPGGGSRNRSAAGTELAIPLVDMLRLTLASRYDRYSEVDHTNGAFTYNAGLEFRPVQNLLLRGSYATSFRAPDMQFVFAGPSTLESSVTDYLRCRRDQHVTDINQCSLLPSSVTTERQGNPNLNDEKGRSWTAGVAWNVTSTLDASLDYFNITLSNEVDDLTSDYILQTEANCRLGTTISGQPVNPNSQLCHFVDGLITRNPANPAVPGRDTLTGVNTLPINRALERVSGLDGTLNYQLDAHRAGKFFFKFAWSHVLKEDRQEIAGDPVVSFRDDPTNYGLRSRMRTSLTWQISKLSQTVFADLQGSRPRFDAIGRTGPYNTYNYVGSYSPTTRLKISLIVDNLLDADPRIDRSFSSYPFFRSSNVNPYGREFFLEGNYKFK